MLPGYLHFDVRRGVRAEMLNAALSSLLPHHDSVRSALDSLGLVDIAFDINENTINGLKGRMVHFYLGDQLIKTNQSPLLYTPKIPHIPRWDNGDKLAYLAQVSASFSTHPFIHDCQTEEKIELARLKDVFATKKLKPKIGALALKILDELESDLFTEQSMTGSEALWLVCHLVMLCAQVDALDPKFITATKLMVGNKLRQKPAAKQCFVTQETWLNALLTHLSVIEVDADVEIDVLAVAFLKALSCQFGARGESTIQKVGIGFHAQGLIANHYVEALFCEAHLPDTIHEETSHTASRLSFCYEISGLVSTSTDMASISSMLSLNGALSLHFHLAHSEKSMAHHVRFFCSSEDKNNVIEAFLVKVGAQNVALRMVERHELSLRTVCVPLGTGNKASSARFQEYIYRDKAVRVEPYQEDLDQYVLNTDYSVDVARSDLLMAWKKWRGRVALESS